MFTGDVFFFSFISYYYPEITLTLPVPAAEYIGKSPADACVRAFFKTKVLETGQVFNDVETADLKKPTIQALVNM